MSNYKIESGVPLPTEPIRPSKYPWPQMQIGDSVEVEGTPATASSARAWTARNLPTARVVARRTSGGRQRIWFAPKELA